MYMNYVFKLNRSTSMFDPLVLSLSFRVFVNDWSGLDGLCRGQHPVIALTQTPLNTGLAAQVCECVRVCEHSFQVR